MHEETPDRGMTRIMADITSFTSGPKTALYMNANGVTDIEKLDWQLFTNYIRYKQQ